MGPNQERIMDQMASRLSVRPQVSVTKTDIYEGIGQRLIGFCVYVSVVVRRFATGDAFVYLQIKISNFSRPRLFKLAKIWKPRLLLLRLHVRERRCCVDLLYDLKRKA